MRYTLSQLCPMSAHRPNGYSPRQSNLHVRRTKHEQIQRHHEGWRGRTAQVIYRGTGRGWLPESKMYFVKRYEPYAQRDPAEGGDKIAQHTPQPRAQLTPNGQRIPEPLERD
tara:strand:- start:873 stop:1208 length:336 start_codon:yes stop_codon:yes gene_type:complete